MKLWNMDSINTDEKEWKYDHIVQIANKNKHNKIRKVQS